MLHNNCNLLLAIYIAPKIRKVVLGIVKEGRHACKNLKHTKLLAPVVVVDAVFNILFLYDLAFNL